MIIIWVWLVLLNKALRWLTGTPSHTQPELAPDCGLGGCCLDDALEVWENEDWENDAHRID